MNLSPERPAPDPTDAEQALADIERRQRAAVLATYDTPWWYFYGLGAALLVFSAVYLLDDWIETHLGFVASVLAYFAGLIFFLACLFTLVLAVAKRQTSQPAKPFKVLASPQLIAWGVGGLVLALAVVNTIVYLAFGSLEYSLAASLVFLAVLIAVGGRPFQLLIRRRVLRQRGLDGGTR